MTKTLQLSNIEFWSLVAALVALVVAIASIGIGLVWSAFQKSIELKTERSMQYHQIAAWVSDASAPSRQIAAVLDLVNYPEFRDASMFLLLQVRNFITGPGTAPLQAAIDRSVSELTKK